MSDYNSSLPIRTENAGDVAVKIVDALIPSQQLTVNADGSINTNISATDLDIRDLTFETDKVDASGSVVSLDAGTLSALESITVQNSDGAGAVNIQDGGNSITVDAADLDIRDLAFATDKVDVSGSTVNAVIVEDPGTEIVNYNTSAVVGVDSSDSHDYTAPSAGKLFQVLASASGKMKIEIQIETAAGSNVFNTLAVAFNSTSEPNINIDLRKHATIPAGAKVRVIRTNKDKQPQDVYSTIIALLN